MASRSTASCACHTGIKWSPCCSHMRDEPAMSVNSSVTTPVGGVDCVLAARVVIALHSLVRAGRDYLAIVAAQVGQRTFGAARNRRFADPAPMRNQRDVEAVGHPR